MHVGTHMWTDLRSEESSVLNVRLTLGAAGGYDAHDGALALSSDPLIVAPERVQRVIDAISMIGIDEHARALEMLPEPASVQDPFDMLDACVRVLIGEVTESQRTSALANRALEASRQQLADKLEVIQRQSVALADLSTPIIEVWDHTLALPIIGAIDGPRAAGIAATLLDAISSRNARNVLLDLTGVEVVDSVTFEHLARLARAVELLGARCTLTGLTAAAATAIVALGIDVGALHTRSTLKDGLRAIIGAAQPQGSLTREPR